MDEKRCRSRVHQLRAFGNFGNFTWTPIGESGYETAMSLTTESGHMQSLQFTVASVKDDLTEVWPPQSYYVIKALVELVHLDSLTLS